MTGLRLEMDLTDKTGILTDGKAELAGILVRGAVLAKTGARTFEIRDGAVTACEGDDPAWEFEVKDGRVTLDDYAKLKTVVFRLGGVPLLYTPYLLWPALRDRASGFLLPGVGYSSSRGGFLGLSYYQVLGRSADATVTTDLYTEKFFGLGTELRLRPSEGTRFTGAYYTVIDPNRAVAVEDLGEHHRRRPRAPDPRRRELDGLLQPRLLPDLRPRLLPHLDPDGGPEGLRDALRGALRLQPEARARDRPLRLDRGRPGEKAGPRGPPAADGALRQHGLRRGADLGRLPALDPAARGQPAGDYGRLDLFPKVSAPLSPVPWLSLNVEAGYRFTQYGASVAADGRSLTDDPYTRTTAQAGLELTGPSFARVFDVKLGKFTKLKHVVEPRVDYQYQTDPGDLSRTPVFDEVDTILPSHAVRYALVQRLLGKEKSGVSREVASLEVSRSHYLELPVGVPESGRDSPLDAVLRVNAGSALNFDARAAWDLAAGVVTSTSVSANIGSAARFLRFSLYDSRPVGAPTPSTQLRFGGGSAILPKALRLDVEANYDIARSRMLEWRSLLTWEASCFKILAEYRDLRIGAIPTKDFRIGLNLKNIGSFLDFTGRVSN